MHEILRSDPPLRELAKFLARRAAEDDHESLLQRQRKKKLKESKEPPKTLEEDHDKNRHLRPLLHRPSERSSIEDQIRLCEKKVREAGGQVFQSYTDHAVSGASLMRPGIQMLMQDAAAGRFDQSSPKRSTGSAVIRKTSQQSTSA